MNFTNPAVRVAIVDGEYVVQGIEHTKLSDLIVMLNPDFLSETFGSMVPGVDEQERLIKAVVAAVCDEIDRRFPLVKSELVH